MIFLELDAIRFFRQSLFMVLSGVLTLGVGSAQNAGDSPAELVRSLTQPPFVDSLLGCGPQENDRAIARTLAKLGASAVPSIESALNSVELHGQQSDSSANVGWLLLTYARIEGPSSVPRLRRMINNPKLAFLRLDIDNAMALALNLTAYIDGRRGLTEVFSCRSGEPRDALNQLILAWERNDRAWVEASLGPQAKSALSSLHSEREWAAMRTEIWHRKAKGDLSVGYRFSIPGRWADPEETLAERSTIVESAGDLRSPQIGVVFKDGSGNDCGNHQVSFLGITKGTVVGAAPPRPNAYLVDSMDIKDLLEIIAACAVGTQKP